MTWNIKERYVKTGKNEKLPQLVGLISKKFKTKFIN